MTDTIIKVNNVVKSFHVGVQDVEVLRGISFTVKQGDFLVIFGPSGCGKSTLLHTVLGLEVPDAGEVVFFDQNLYENTTEDDRSEFRKRHMGIIYQQPNWIKSLTVIENIAFPLSLLGTSKSEAIQKSAQILQSLELSNWVNYQPTELSSGQQQKVALARGMVINPEVLVADEPTGNLDYESGQDLMEMLLKLNKEGKTIIMVTHDLEYLAFAKSAIQMFDGKIVKVYEGKEKDALLRKTKTKRGDLMVHLTPKAAEEKKVS